MSDNQQGRTEHMLVPDILNEMTKVWSNTPLGPVNHWSQSLYTSASLCLNSQFPIAIWWGKELYCIHNESFRTLLEHAFGKALDANDLKFGSEFWNELGLSLPTVIEKGIPITETKHFTNQSGSASLIFYSSPIYDAHKVGGVFTTVKQQVELLSFGNNYTSDSNPLSQSSEAQKDRFKEKARQRKILLKTTNAQLMRSEERYTKMIEEVEDYAIISLDIDGTILNWNKGAQKIKGYSEEEIVGQNLSVFYLEEDLVRQLPQTLIRTAMNEGRATHEGFRKRKDGSKFWGSVVITALHDDQGQVIGFTKVTRDLTERKAAEDLIRHHASQLELKNKQLEQFAYIASHDLQEPLRKIQTFVQVLEKKFDDMEVRQKYFAKINLSAKRMAELIQSVLHYSRLAHPGELTTQVNLTEIMESVLGDYELAVTEKNAEVKYDRLPIIPGIVPQLEQLFANLVGNSLKFSKENPKIQISSRHLTGDEVLNYFPGADASREYVELCFSDNGIGFEQQYAEKIFSIFQRLNTKEEFAGTGIGLALSKKIVENHNGHIIAKSDLGKGATFLIYLPYK